MRVRARTIVVAAVVPTAAHLVPALTSRSALLRATFGVRDRVPGAGDVALTFDDGPHPEGTPAVLERLATAGARATFFLVGEQAERYPELVAEIADGGHAIGIHCHRHRLLLRLTPSQTCDDLARAANAIETAAGHEVRLYRPPYGIFSATALLAIRWRRLQPVLWTHDSRDWRARTSPADILAGATRALDPGTIVLLHDADHYASARCFERTVAILPKLLDILQRRGLRPVALDRGGGAPRVTGSATASATSAPA